MGTEGAHTAGEKWALRGSDDEVRDRDGFFDRSLGGVCHGHGGGDGTAVPTCTIEIPDVDIATRLNSCHQVANIVSDACEGRAGGNCVDRKSTHPGGLYFWLMVWKRKAWSGHMGYGVRAIGVKTRLTHLAGTALPPQDLRVMRSMESSPLARQTERRPRRAGSLGYCVVWRVSLWYVRDALGRWSVGR